MAPYAVHWGWLDTVPGFPDRLRENPPCAYQKPHTHGLRD